MVTPPSLERAIAAIEIRGTSWRNRPPIAVQIFDHRPTAMAEGGAAGESRRCF